MKKLIAGIVAGLVLGIAGTGVAATTSLWNGSGVGYRCWGIDGGFQCNGAGYQLGMTKSYVYLQKGAHPGNKVFGCNKYATWRSCTNFAAP